MSYILDALKKSDQERKHSEVPGLNSFQDQPKPPIATSRILLYFLIGAMLINALAIGLWLNFRQAPEDITIASSPAESTEHSELTTATSPTAEPAVTKAAKSPAEAEPETAAEAEPTTDGSEDTSQSAEIIAEEQAEEEVPTEDEKGELTQTSFEKLPADIRSDLPKLTIAAHYYAGKPSARMASINGRIMREGQTINDGLVLEEITKEGVIFRFRDYLFTMDVFVR